MEGGKYGSIDPCYPSKVGQAHIHNLLFHHHTEERKLNLIFFPTLTHVPSFVKKAMDYTSCPIVAGAPNVLKAAFTKEIDFFAQRGIKYLDPACSMIEPTLLRKQLFECFREHLDITEDESDFACDEAWQAMKKLDVEMEAKGKTILEQVEKEDRIAILMLGRPYHLDPGLNHSIPEEFQVLGYPVLSIRSIPKDEAWLTRFFEEDLQKGRITTPLEIGDVWPENYSSNSAQKVWAAKFAAHHPNVVVLDLSSFKCGHDAPDLRHHRQHHRHGADAVLGAARHRRQQAGRLDQDPRQDLRPQPDAAQGAARGREPARSRSCCTRSTRSG